MSRNNEQRYVCENWDRGAEVLVKTRGRGRLPSRKVKTTGIERIKLTAGQIMEVVRLLREGRDVRFAYEGEDAWRIFPCLNADGKMVAVAQSMGSFRLNTYVGKKVRLMSANGRRELEPGEYERRVRKAREERLACVTPDTTVSCPKCGYSFRVGKKLANVA